MTTIPELVSSRLKDRPILPPIKESWREYSILLLILGGGIAMGSGMSGIGIASLLAGSTWSISETIRS